ncbi:efflux RND transporter permease subunit [Roseivirga echinicomitans]|uniref:Cation transporter n=1 Tax=Roseivirga echinicomitans TaxID=296218 RepID=A0A150XD98_9BACT|nr:efflux RND transporter permease subunit [Roseivirga echinicomitans]KYG76688.1 cation transporter [Roseivirga echinicomitans]
MVKFLINRPVAVFLSFIGILFFSFLALQRLPVSLLPNIEVPAIIVKVNYPNNPPSIIENSILNPIRTSLNTLNNLKSVESIANSETGMLKLQFEFGTRMDLAYIEINEKIDRLQESLPRDMDRPQVVRINTSDIPIARIQVIPKEGIDYTQTSELTDRVLKKRIEQIIGVSIVDVNGFQGQFISITPDLEKIRALGLSEQQIDQVLQGANRDLGRLSVKDGQYRYFVRIANRLDNIIEIENLPIINREGDVIKLSDIAEVSFQSDKRQGYHLSNQKEGLVVTVHKQAKAKMTELTPLLYEAVENFKKDYPQTDFELTQDQSLLLNAGINNLKTSLIYGGIFAFAVLFLFMGNVRMPIMMGITLPISLLISFLFFYAFGLSVNIISLSGLALGLGMLIDNSIIVIDNITRKRKDGLDIREACIQGVNEVMTPLISSVLTTLAVFVPLVFLNGLSGALFYDQALSVAIILGTSLMVAFVLLPLLYRKFFENLKSPIKEDSLIFKGILKLYKSTFKVVWRFKTLSLILLLALIPLAYFMIIGAHKEGLPAIEKTETLLSIQWNEPLDAEENKRRVLDLLEKTASATPSESDIGLKQFLLAEQSNSIESAEVYFKSESMDAKLDLEQKLTAFLENTYRTASFQVEDAPNAFDQIFSSEQKFFIAKWKKLSGSERLDEAMFANLEKDVAELVNEKPRAGNGFQFGESMEAVIDNKALSFYGISENAMKDALSKALDGYLVTEIRRFGEVTPIWIQRGTEDFRSKLNGISVEGRENQMYPLSNFVKFEYIKDIKSVTADKTGIYQSLEWENLDDASIDRLQEQLPARAAQYGLSVDFDGAYFQGRENLQQLIFILMISVLLLYFILAAQFESLVQPLIVILTLPLGVAGALLVLMIAGGTLNVMSAIGIIVMLGIMVNDAILKIDTINRLREEFSLSDPTNTKRQVLQNAIAKTGQIRLKPILMTSITTILALLPVVFSSGIGADLQRPLVYTVIGGLTIGTFTALFFVPLSYWVISKKKY